MFESSRINLKQLQKKLFCVAYKMLGEIAQSEDVAQESIAIYLSKLAKKELPEIKNIAYLLWLIPFFISDLTYLCHIWWSLLF